MEIRSSLFEAFACFEALAEIRSVASEVAQAAAAKLVGAEISQSDADGAVQRSIEERG